MTRSTLRVWLPSVAALIAVSVATPVSQQGPPPTSITKVVGDSHKLALRANGEVIGWGRWLTGQLGPVEGLDRSQAGTRRPATIPLPGRAKDVATRLNTSFALLENGSVWAWGDGQGGAFGTGTEPNLPLLPHSTNAMHYRGAERPVLVGVSASRKIVAAEVGAFALLTDGTVSMWPPPGSGALAARPITLEGLAGVTDIAAAWSHALALTKDGRVWTWGNNRYGALGRKPKEDRFDDKPAPVAGLSGVLCITAAGDVSFAVKNDGTVWVWGSNGQAQFGNGQRTSHPSAGTQATPQRVPGVTNVVAISAATNGRHVMALLKDGTLRAWGNTDWGQVGAGLTATFQPSPVTPKIAGVKSVFAVGNNTFAVKTDGSFWGWGSGDKDQWPFAANTRVPTAITVP